jgi:preprotein translocase subunit SecG
MKKIMWFLLIFMVVCLIGVLILQREAKQKVYSHLGAGKYEIKNA